jgi:hypothetical protein
MKIQIRLGEVVVQINFFSEILYDRFCEFQTCSKPQYSLSLTEERIDEERALLLKEYPKCKFPYYEIEYNALYRDIPQLLFSERVLIFHGVLLEMNGDGYLFTGDSGIGKTTHALLWKKTFPDKVSIINGDKPLLKIKDNILYGYGSPWKGKENIGSNNHIKIKAICNIHRSNKNYIDIVENKNDAIPWLLNQTMLKNREQHWGKIIKWYNQMLQCVKTYNLFCNMDDDAALVAFHGMS